MRCADLLEQQMAIEDAAADAAVAAVARPQPDVGGGFGGSYARAVGRDFPKRTEWSECCVLSG